MSCLDSLPFGPELSVLGRRARAAARVMAAAEPAAKAAALNIRADRLE